MVVNCNIQFENNTQGIYFAGQVLQGKVELEVDHPKDLKAVTLNINGFAHTEWTESHSTSTTNSDDRSTTQTSTTTYTGQEDYVATKTYLKGSHDGPSILLEPGIHSYTFACHIPPNCPSSFEGLHGHIRYKVKVVLKRPWKFDQSFTKGFTVLHVLDLNYENPMLRMVTMSNAAKTFCCGPCESGALKVHMSVPQSGYVPGQRIPIAVLVTNESNVAVKEVQLQLMMHVFYRSQFPTSNTENERTVVTKLNGGVGVFRNSNKLFNYELEVPATPPSCVHYCSLIQIDYCVEAEVKISGWHANQVLSLPVTIGNVPLMPMDVILQQPGTSGNSSRQVSLTATVANGSTEHKELETSFNAETSVLSPWEANTNIPPPSYEEATHTARANINANEAHDYGQSDFAPRYPVFNVPSPSTPTEESAQNDAT